MAFRNLRIFLAGLALVAAGCGSDPVPPALTSPQEEDRYRGLQEAQGRSGDKVLAALFQVASEDSNEFLRAQALSSLAQRLPEGDPPPGFLRTLLKAITEDPDLNRRSAGILLLHYKRLKVLREVALVFRQSPSAATRRALAEAAAKILTPEELAPSWNSPRENLRHFTQEAVWIQTKIRTGGHY